MTQEKRKESRAGTHIIAEISMDGQFQKYCGYIENLSKEGMGIISLDSFVPGEEVTSSFYLANSPGKICAKASLVHSERGAYNLYYHGFKFESLNEKEIQAIENYLSDKLLTRPA